MSPVLTVLVEKLDAHDGEMSFAALTEGLDFLQLQGVPSAITEGKALGVIERKNIYDKTTKTTSFLIRKVGD